MLAFLGLIPLKDWLYIGIVVVALGSVAYFHHSWYNQGYQAAIADINAANAKANENASKGQTSVDDCFNSGGSWDRNNGLCVAAPSK
jgi:uncharacterized protein (UPF0333 family)